jgi:hypothetical protein
MADKKYVDENQVLEPTRGSTISSESEEKVEEHRSGDEPELDSAPDDPDEFWTTKWDREKKEVIHEAK